MIKLLQGPMGMQCYQLKVGLHYHHLLLQLRMQINTQRSVQTHTQVNNPAGFHPNYVA